MKNRCTQIYATPPTGPRFLDDEPGLAHVAGSAADQARGELVQKKGLERYKRIPNVEKLEPQVEKKTL